MPDVREQEQAALDAVLSSKTFARCPSLANLLQYICRKYLEGSAENLKEYNIGTEALGRTEDFDPTENSIVRVEVHRLRDKLKRYYEEEGAGDPLMISLQPGNYVPQFVRKDAPALAGKAPPSTETANTSHESEALVPALPATFAHNGSIEERRRFPGTRGLKRPGWTTFFLVAIACLAVVVALLGLHLETLSRARSLGSSVSLPGGMPGMNGTSSRSVGTERESVVRILAGYTKEEYVDRAGQTWQSDRYFSGGQGAAQTERFFTGTSDPTLFRTYRSGDFSYNIPLVPGNYELRLYFVETAFGAQTLSGGGETSRLFTVTLNGKPILNDFDILSDADGEGVADLRVFKDVSPASDGYLHLKFERDISDPLVSAVEVVPAPLGRINPIRVVADDSSFTDHAGHFWKPDRYFENGRLALRKVPVEGTPDPGLYIGERFGHFNYTIPVAPGRYRLTLSFAETYFGASNPGGGGVGSRTFDVYCNGETLLRKFDICREAGGPNRALQKTFHNLEPNAQGKLILRFVPVTNYACLNAIEVEDESK